MGGYLDNSSQLNKRFRRFMQQKIEFNTTTSTIDSPGVGRNSSNDTPDHYENNFDDTKRRKRNSLGVDDDVQPEYNNFGNDDFGNDDFGNDDFGNDGCGMNGEMNEGVSNTQQGAKSLMSSSKQKLRFNYVEATNESELIINMKQSGMTEENCVNFHQVCFGIQLKDGEDKNDDDSNALPSRSVAAKTFFALLLACNNMRVIPKQEKVWGSIHVSACGDV